MVDEGRFFFVPGLSRSTRSSIRPAPATPSPAASWATWRARPALDAGGAPPGDRLRQRHGLVHRGGLLARPPPAARPDGEIEDATGLPGDDAGRAVGHVATEVRPSTSGCSTCSVSWRSVVVAFSGGVDSTFLGRAAKQALGDRALARHRGLGDATPRVSWTRHGGWRRSSACRTAWCARTSWTNPAYAENPPNRCFFCKEELFTRLGRHRRRRGMAHAGVRRDHGRPGRPPAGHGGGARARRAGAADRGRHGRPTSARCPGPRGCPRGTSRRSRACRRASRTGTPITAEKLRQVDGAEAFLRGWGSASSGCGTTAELARLEIAREEMPRLWEEGRAEAIVAAAARARLSSIVTLDLAGLPQRQRERGVLRWTGKRAG